MLKVLCQYLSIYFFRSMRRTVSYFFLILVHTCGGNNPGFPGRILRHDFDKDTTMHEKLRNIELIKTKIEQTLGIHRTPITKTRIQQIKPENQTKDYKIPQVTSYYSEPSGEDDSKNCFNLYIRCLL